MKRSARRSISIALSVVLLCNSIPVMAVGPTIMSLPSSSTQPVSDRLIVKFKPNNLPRGLSVAQIHARLAQPLSAQTVSQLQAAAGTTLTELNAISNGAHVLAVAGHPNRQAIDNAIAAISSLPNVEYVEEDKILTAQFVPNDTYYSTPSPYPTLWGMWPASTVAASAPGSTGSYGADFQTAWDTVTGAGVVVAVVDTGITPNLDIVGPSGTVAAGAGSNLVSAGYDFITDCRMRGTCAATTATGSAYIAPSADATDRGSFLSAADCSTAGSYFYGCTPSNSSWHGTHVAGTIAALGNNNRGVIGGAYESKILPVRVLGKGGGTMSDIAEAVKWAAGVHPSIPNDHPAKVINMSLGGGGASCGATMQSAIDAVVAAGTVVVVAAGNSNLDVANFTPANCQNVITVAAIGRDGSRATYSNFSSPASNTTNPINVTLAAQGGDQDRGDFAFDAGILSTLNSGTTTPVMTGGSNYVWYQGTSMATPHVAAAAALMIAKNPLLTPAQIKTILSAPSSLTAFPVFAAGSYPVLNNTDCSVGQNCGAGILNANLALQNTPFAPLTASPATDFGSVIVSGTTSKTITLTNTSQASVQVGTATVTGTDAALFTPSADNCSTAVIAPNGTCQLTLSYAPVAGGAHAAMLTVPVSGATSSTLVSLNGSAGTTALTTTTPDVTAATVTAGQSTTVDLNYTNPNGNALRTGAISLSNPAIMAASTDGCSNQTLGANASCTVTVTVTPTAAGSYSGTASLALSGGGTAALSTITGSANPVPAPAPAPSSGGGGCSIMPFGADPDASLLLAMLAVAAYWLRRRIVRERSAA